MNGLRPVSENTQQCRFLGIAHGRITHKNRETGETDLYQDVTGVLTGITTREAEFSGQKMTFYVLHLVNGDERYSLSVGRDTSVARGLINSLASAQDFSRPLVIRPWETDEDEQGRRFTNVNVYVEKISKENKLPWAVELPKVKYTTVGRKTFADDTDRFNAVEMLVQQINARCSGTPVPAPAQAAPVELTGPGVPDDMPAYGEF